MTRNFAKKNASTKRLTSTQLGLLMGALITVFCTAGFFIYLHKKPQTEITMISYFSRMKLWLSERKTHLNQGLVKVKQLAANKNDLQPIHFEFYSALPNMQIKLSELNTPEQNAIGKTKTVLRNDKPAITNNFIKSAMTQKPTTVAVSSTIVSANELEQELSTQLDQQKSSSKLKREKK